MAFSSKQRFLDSSTLRSLRLPPSSTREIIIIDDDDEDEDVVILEPAKKKPRLGSWWDNVEPFDELACVVKGTPEAKEDNDIVSTTDSWFSSTALQVTETKKTNDNERSLTKKKGYEHVNLEDLGVSKEDLMSIPWEAFDQTWEIRSDPWFGGYMASLFD